ncbi:V-type ATP synthase subunit E [Gammaproteobacteria bacterium]
MNALANVEELERALLARAQTLAEEYLERARRSRDRILDEENERLSLREDREVLAAKALAERTYRRQVQQAELTRQEEFDRLRWTLIRGVMDILAERLARIAHDEEHYLPILSQFLAHAAHAIERKDLVCEINATDLHRLHARWDSFSRVAVPDHHIILHHEPRHCSGGLLLRTTDDRIRVDNTFEGRLARMEEQLERVIRKRLFATAGSATGVAHFGALFNG